MIQLVRIIANKFRELTTDEIILTKANLNEVESAY